jgi:sortase A
MRLFRTPGSRRIASWAERSLWALGLSLLGYWGWSQAAIRFEQARLEQSLFGAHPAVASTMGDEDALASDLPATAPEATAPVLEPGTPVALIEIPRVEVHAMVVEGVDDHALKRAAGHLPGTALPGANGNSVVAAHRDTLFAGLRHVRLGDRVTMRTDQQLYSYRVSAIDVVTPRSVHVLDPTPEPSLTLITCFPFDYVGPAPMRYVVTAVLDGETAADGALPADLPAARRDHGRQHEPAPRRPLDARVLSLLSGSLVKPGAS